MNASSSIKKALLALCVVAWGLGADAQLTSNTMMKIVTRSVAPGVATNSFAGQPRTLYRMGDRYGRSVEPRHATRKRHRMLVVAEPDIWMINLWDKTGVHVVDPGPTYIYRASVIPSQARRQPPPQRDFEFGREYDFLRANGAAASKASVDGRAYDALDLTIDGYVIRLLSQVGADVPYRVEVKRGEDVLCRYQYIEYVRDLPPDMALFAPPDDVRIKKVER